MIITDGMILYHGSYAEIDDIDLTLCDDAKDFGKGFYLTTSSEQAISFIKTSLSKAKRNGRVPEEQNFGYVTSFTVHLNPNVKYYEFESVNDDWLYYISMNRRQNLRDRLSGLIDHDFSTYDIIAGKIANDDTNVTLNAFLTGVFGEVGEKSTLEIVKRLLNPERLENQLCFKTQQSLQLLKKTGAKKYEIGKN